MGHVPHPPTHTPPSLPPTPRSGLHFLAVQPDPDSEDVTGLWLLQDRMPPNV